jgi:hypothetical protein
VAAVSELTPEERREVVLASGPQTPATAANLIAAVERIVAAHVERATADAEARAWDEGYDSRRQFCRTGHYDLPEQNPYRRPAPTTDADGHDERRDGAGGSRWERG